MPRLFECFHLPCKIISKTTCYCRDQRTTGDTYYLVQGFVFSRNAALTAGFKLPTMNTLTVLFQTLLSRSKGAHFPCTTRPNRKGKRRLYMHDKQVVRMVTRRKAVYELYQVEPCPPNRGHAHATKLVAFILMYAAQLSSS
jgi:hypothetical protein